MATDSSAIPDIANWVLSAGVVIGTAVGAAIAYLRRPVAKVETTEAALVANALASDRQMIEDLIKGVKAATAELERLNIHLRDAALQAHDEEIIKRFVDAVARTKD